MKRACMNIRFLSVLVAIVLSVCTFTACGNSVADSDNDSVVADGSAATAESEPAEEPVREGFELHFIDVGQGDCMLLIADGEAMLIDSGNVGQGEVVVEYMKAQGVTKLKYLMLTHGHADHVGGMPEVMENFSFDTLFLFDVPCDEEPYQEFLSIIEDRNIETIMPELGSKFLLGDGEFTILGPSKPDYLNLNNNSISIKYVYGDKSFLLCGDAQTSQEQDLMTFASQNGIDLKSDVWKANHHASLAGCTQSFIDTVGAEFAVVQVGADNIYSYPGEATMARLESSGATVYRNDLNGTVIVKCNGKTLEWILSK